MKRKINSQEMRWKVNKLEMLSNQKQILILCTTRVTFHPRSIVSGNCYLSKHGLLVRYLGSYSYTFRFPHVTNQGSQFHAYTAIAIILLDVKGAVSNALILASCTSVCQRIQDYYKLCKQDSHGRNIQLVESRRQSDAKTSL